jgi:hypothetical protein
MELNFELNTQLTVSCVVAVVLAYDITSVSIAFNSVPLAFAHAIILVLILFVLFGWSDFLGKFQKKLLQQNR